HDRVDGSRPELHALEDRRAAAFDVADREQQHVRRRLRHGEADPDMDEVLARDDPVQADYADPRGDGVRQVAHAVPSGTMYSSRNSLKRTMFAAETSSATAQFTKIALPPDSSVPVAPG